MRAQCEIEPGPLAMMLLAGIEVSALDEGARIDVAAAWERQQSWVANRLEVADRLVRHLPLVFGLLTAGDISFRHAWVLADAVAELLPAEMMAVEAKVVERARRPRPWHSFAGRCAGR